MTLLVKTPQATAKLHPTTTTRADVAPALAQLRERHQGSTRDVQALDLLNAAKWTYDGELLHIASASTPGTQYSVSYDGCTCPAGVHGKAWVVMQM